MSTKQSKGLLVRDLIANFKFDVIYKGSSKNRIMIPSLNRTGIELASKHFVFREIISAVLWSGNESKFLFQLSKKARRDAMENVFHRNPPVIIITEAFQHKDLLLSVCKKYKTTILYSSLPSSQLYVTVAAWIIEKMAQYTTYHGTLINVFGIGVLLKGESGVGKSEIALEMVRKGHIFIADDAVDVAKIADHLIGRPNAIANNFIEVRGLGILNIPKMLGIEKIQSSSNIDIVIELVLDDKKQIEFERLGSKTKLIELNKAMVPYYCLPITPGRKMADLIETAVIDMKLKQKGYSSADDYIKNFYKLNKK